MKRAKLSTTLRANKLVSFTILAFLFIYYASLIIYYTNSNVPASSSLMNTKTNKLSSVTIETASEKYVKQ